eukprot:3308946-Karenia_brevis.AAC.1
MHQIEDPDSEAGQSMWAWYENYMNGNCDYMHQWFLENTGTLFVVNYAIFLILKKHNMLQMLKYVLRFAAPTEDGVPHILQNRADVDKLKAMM